MKRTRLFLVVFLGMAFSVFPEDWPRWRGPSLNGISTEKNWSSDWGSGPKVAWRGNVGLGYSSVVVADGRLFTQGNIRDQDTVYCLDAVTGKEIWKHTYAEKTDPKYYQGGTSATPTVDGKVVITVAKSGLTHCLDVATGRMLWKQDVLRAIGAKKPTWGLAGSALVIGNAIYLNAGSNGVALNKQTGAVIWKSGNGAAGYSTPVPYRTQTGFALAMFSEKAVVGVDSTNGRRLWQYPWVTKYDMNAPDPIIVGRHMFITSGYGHGGALLEFTNAGPRKVWENKNMRAQMNGPILIGQHLYGIDGDARRFTLKCIELATGKEVWKGDNISGLMAADGKLICQGETGTLYIVAASPKSYRKLAQANVFRDVSWSTPVLANGRIYCRGGKGSLVCLDVRKQ